MKKYSCNSYILILICMISLISSQTFDVNIIFSSNISGSYDIWTMNPDGGNLVQITHTTDDDFGPVISHSGKKIAFVRNGNQTNEHYIMIFDIVTEVIDTLYNCDIPIYPHLSFYPNDTLLLFSQDLLYNQTGENGEVFSLDINTGDTTNITNTAAYHNESGGDVSSTRIIYEKDTNGWACGYCVELFMMDFYGTNDTQITNSYGHDMEPRIIGDSLIVYRHDHGAGTETINLINPDGSNQTELTPGYYPTWSPDGTQIAYVLNDAIWKCNKDGSNPIQLSEDGAVFKTPYWGLMIQTNDVVFDFEDQSLDNWIHTEYPPGAGSYRIAEGSLNGFGNYLLEVECDNPLSNEDDRSTLYYEPSLDWERYNLHYDFKCVNSTWNKAIVYFYAQSIDSIYGNGYSLYNSPSYNSFQLGKGTDGGQTQTEIISVPYPISSGVTYSCDIIIDGDNIALFVDGEEVFDVIDNTYRSGAFGLGSGNAGLENDRITQYDNVIIDFNDTLDSIYLSVDTVNAVLSQFISMPLYVSFPDEHAYNALEMTVSGYSDDIAFIGIDTVGTIVGAADWLLEVNETSSGLNIAGAGSNDISDDGILLNLMFEANGGICETVPVNISNILFNTGSDSVIVNNGGVYIEPIPDYGDVDENGLIQAYDASMILKHLVGMDTLDCQGLANAEVSLNDTITAYDASLILQNNVGLIDTLPYITPVLASGDLALPDLTTVSSGTPVDIPITINNQGNIYSYESRISFDPDKLSYSGISWTGFMGDSIQDSVELGIIKLAGASGTAHNGDGEIATLHFITQSDFVQGNTMIKISELRFNENPVLHDVGETEVRLGIGDELSTLPKEFALHQNYPNPFNPTTTLHFDVPKESNVRIIIYNLMGREVTELINRQESAGRHQVVWNGKTATGKEAPTGMYFARMVTPGYAKTIKMVLMK